MFGGCAFGATASPPRAEMTKARTLPVQKSAPFQWFWWSRLSESN